MIRSKRLANWHSQEAGILFYPEHLLMMLQFQHCKLESLQTAGAHSVQEPVWLVVSSPAKKKVATSGSSLSSLSASPERGSLRGTHRESLLSERRATPSWQLCSCRIDLRAVWASHIMLWPPGTASVQCLSLSAAAITATLASLLALAGAHCKLCVVESLHNAREGTCFEALFSIHCKVCWG